MKIIAVEEQFIVKQMPFLPQNVPIDAKELYLSFDKDYKIISLILMLAFMVVFFAGCSTNNTNEGISFDAEAQSSANVGEYSDAENMSGVDNQSDAKIGTDTDGQDKEMPSVTPGEIATEKSVYIDNNGDTAIIPAQFTVSTNEDEQTINSGLVIIGSDESEFVWVPTTITPLAVHDFGSYFSGGDSLSGYSDETALETYQAMAASVELYGGFYIGRYEASKGDDGLPASKRIADNDDGQIWVQFSPQDTTLLCEELYADNNTVQGFFPWGVNWDTTLRWLIDSGCKTEAEVASDSTSWGNYSNDSFSEGAKGDLTGKWEEAKANNIYDLAGNNWEWTQERYGTSYVMRGGGYNLMGGDCRGDRYPAALRDPLPGNNHHPNVTFRIALYLK